MKQSRWRGVNFSEGAIYQDPKSCTSHKHKTCCSVFDIFILWGKLSPNQTQPLKGFRRQPWLQWGIREILPTSLPSIHHWFLILSVSWSQWGVLTASATHTLNPCLEVYADLQHESAVWDYMEWVMSAEEMPTVLFRGRVGGNTRCRYMWFVGQHWRIRCWWGKDHRVKTIGSNSTFTNISSQMTK